MSESLDDIRAAERLDWARSALHNRVIELERASTDAGFRSYWRTVGMSPSRIIMDSPTDKEDVRPWLHMRKVLEAAGVRVPEVLAEDVENGFLLLEDLGTHTYLHDIDESNADAFFDAAIMQLIKVQKAQAPAETPRYDDEMLGRELRLFDTWFCSTHLGLSLDCGEMETLDAAYRFLINSAIAQNTVLVHRDFMPRNLMQATDGPAVLDFQDAVIGPIAYDALSLFKDAFLSWPAERVDGWLQRYHAMADAEGLPVPALDAFIRDAELIGVQRHLKVIGIFARLQHRDHKPKYLSDVPRFFQYLDDVLPKYSELAGLQAFIETRVKPAMAARETIGKDAAI